MSLMNRTQIQQFIADNHLKTPEDVQNPLKTVFAETLQAMLVGELAAHLGYEKYAIQHKRATDKVRLNQRSFLSCVQLKQKRYNLRSYPFSARYTEPATTKGRQAKMLVRVSI